MLAALSVTKQCSLLLLIPHLSSISTHFNRMASPVWEPGRGLAQNMVDFLSKELGDNQCAVRLMRQIHLASRIDSLTLKNTRHYIWGIVVSVMYLRLGRTYLGSAVRKTQTKPTLSTIENGWQSKAIISPTLVVISTVCGSQEFQSFVLLLLSFLKSHVSKSCSWILSSAVH